MNTNLLNITARSYPEWMRANSEIRDGAVVRHGAVDFTGVNLQTIMSLVREKKVRASKPNSKSRGGAVWFNVHDIMNWLTEQSENAENEQLYPPKKAAQSGERAKAAQEVLKL